jgi:hypothetical protein
MSSAVEEPTATAHLITGLALFQVNFGGIQTSQRCASALLDQEDRVAGTGANLIFLDFCGALDSRGG